MKPEVLVLTNISVVYPNGFRAVQNVNLTVGARECVALVGASGSGKTTLAHAILGLLPAKTIVTGSILVGETEVVGASVKILRRVRGLIVGFIAQNPFAAANPLRTIFDFVGEAWRVHGLPAPRAEIITRLADLGIENAAVKAQNRPYEWSGGMLQRAGIAAAAAHRPALVVADEPTSALDKLRADSILTLLRRSDAAILLISHDLRLVAKHADRIAVCLGGRIIEINSASEILANPQHEYTKQLLEASSDVEKRVDDSSNREIVLRAENLSQIYYRSGMTTRAVRRADLVVRRGEIVGIAGDSGTGKSTLLRLLATIETPATGSVWFADELATSSSGGGSSAGNKVSRRKARSGFVMPIFQDPLASLDRRWAIWRSVTEPLTAPHRRRRLSKTERRTIAQRILSEVGLQTVDLDARPRELSIGQCQRACIARALVAEPAIILADEPTSALDRASGAEIVKLFARAAERGIAVVIVSHDETMLEKLCHRILKMSGGVLQHQQTSNGET